VTARESSLRRESSQSKPFRSRQQEAVLGLARTAALVKRAGARLAESCGLSPEQ